MARYVYCWTELWRENTRIVDQELEELAGWLHKAQIDPDFDPNEHVYIKPNGDRWLFLPELSPAQLFAMSLVMSSSTLEDDNGPVRFDTPPNTNTDEILH